MSLETMMILRLLSLFLCISSSFGVVCELCGAGLVPGKPTYVINGIPIVTGMTCQQAYDLGQKQLLSPINCNLIISDGYSTTCQCQKKTPIKSPVKSPVKKPVKKPIKSPVKSPVKKPIKKPT